MKFWNQSGPGASLASSSIGTVEPDALLAHLEAEGLSRYDMPEYFVALDAFPLTASGKVDRRALTALEELLTWRRQLVEMLTVERNRLLLARGPVRRDLQQHIRFLERRLREVDDDLHTAVKASPAWRVKDDLLHSWPSCPSSAGSATRTSPPSSA